nr:immunoglobulin heavy chain junction region [Macaca mulatta]MOV51409.1 immunoglobulin heavy chain junction region [Macaca mulatta]
CARVIYSNRFDVW